MIEFYIGLRVNQFVIICGRSIDGKSTIWQTLNKAIGAFHSNSIEPKCSEIFKKYSLLVNFLSDEQMFPKILAYHLFPGVYNNIEPLIVDEKEKTLPKKQNLLNKIIEQSESSYLATYNLQKEHSGTNKKVNYRQIERWIILDADINESILLDQVSLLKKKSPSAPTNVSDIPETIKFIFETQEMNDLNPAVISKAMFVFQQDLEWQSVLETKINKLSLQFSIPQSKISILHEYSNRFFNEIKEKLNNFEYKSALHGGLALKKLNMNNFVFAYVNLLECLLKKHVEELKQPNEESVNNWKSLRLLSGFSFFWSIAMFISSPSDLNEFNEVVSEMFKKCRVDLEPSNLKLYDAAISIEQNSLIQFQSHFQNNISNKDWIINEYQYQAELLRMCIESGKPSLVYGDIGVGKSTLIEKLTANKFDHIRLVHSEPSNSLYRTLIRHTPLCRAKKNSSLNAHKFNFVYFIDDLNMSAKCSSENQPSRSYGAELARHLLETSSLYSPEDEQITPFSDINYILGCTLPDKTPNSQPLKQSLTKHLICVNLNAKQTNLIESVFLSPIQHWLEEFPPDAVLYPAELAHAIIKCLSEIYESIRAQLKPVPSKPQYLFNLKDVARVAQGLQILASKSKLLPSKINKKTKEQQNAASAQVANILKLFSHEIQRVFGDRITDPKDERWLRATISNYFVTNFFQARNPDNFNFRRSSRETEMTIHENSMQLSSDAASRPKKVTFKAGLLSERDFKGYFGPLITKEQLSVFNDETFSNIVFSKFIIRQSGMSSQKGSERSIYSENSLSDLMNAATASLDLYETKKNLRMNFFFHEEALRHLARLTRVFSMSRGNALLISKQYGLGRTNSVRLAAFLSKMRYFESRITDDEVKSEKYLKAVLRQACLIAGIKGSNCIVYVKSEFQSHRIIENLCVFVRTGNYPNLFNEKQILHIVNEISPAIPSIKRIEKTQLVYNNFLNYVQERVHLVISLDSQLTNLKLCNLLREHSALFTDFYVDVYRPLKSETLNAIARYYLALQNEESRARKLHTKNKFSRFDDEDENLSAREIQVFSATMCELHQAAYDQYSHVYTASQKYHARAVNNNRLMPKPFSASMFKQVAIFFRIYMRRFKEHESVKVDKFERAFGKIAQVTEKIASYDGEAAQLRKSLGDLEGVLANWDGKIERQKEIYRTAVDECRKEEKLIEEMGVVLEGLRADVNQDSQDMNNSSSPQYELAVAAIQALSESAFNELKSYRKPPQRVLAIVNTLCLMFRQAPGWESGKALLMRPNFFDDLVFYDKKNIPDDIYNALSQICAVETFSPECVAPGSHSAALFCEWILAVYAFATFERTHGVKIKELRDYEELYNNRLISLGEKRLNAEKICQVLEGFCAERVLVLKEMKRIHVDIDNLKEDEEKAKELLRLLDNDHKNWLEQYEHSLQLLKTYKMDALFVACFMAYAGVFDSDMRRKLLEKWHSSLAKLAQTLAAKSIKLDAEKTTEPQNKFSLRNNFNIKQILLNSYENKDLLIQLNKMSLKDEYFIENALILREISALPSLMSWPLVYDPENLVIKTMALIQESSDGIKNTVNADVHFSSPVTVNSGEPLKKIDSLNLEQSDCGELAVNDSTFVERELSMADEVTDEGKLNGMERVESLPPPFSASSSRISRKSFNTQLSERSSIWEASTFFSRSQTANTMYHSKSGRALLPSLTTEFEHELSVPLIETDLNILPKDNLCLLDSADADLDYKLVNAAVHGVAVVLKNSERHSAPSRLVEAIIERDFFVDSQSNREYLKIGEEEIVISPSFKLILHVSTPIALTSPSANFLFHRLSSQNNAAHALLDFSPSVEFIGSDFLCTVMELEKPGYANQSLLHDRLLIEAEFSIANRQEEIIERLNSFDESILDDKRMLAYITDKNARLKEFHDSHSEALHIEKGLKEMSRNYKAMSRNFSAIFRTIKSLYVIQPAYYLSWSLVKRLVLSEIDQVLKERGAIGAARAKQIEKFTMSLIYKHLSFSLSKNHFSLFLLLHFNSLKSLNTRANQKKGLKQQQQQLQTELKSDEEAFYSLLSQALSNNELQALCQEDFSILNSQPDFIGLNSWVNCWRMEKSAPGSMKDLCVSMRENCTKWVEHYRLSQAEADTPTPDLTQKDVDLLNDSPLGAQLGLVEKLALWLCLRPDKTFEILNKFNIYNFGGLIPQRCEFDLASAYKISAPHLPFLVMLTKDNPYVNITDEITKYAKQVSAEIKVMILPLDHENTRMKRIDVALREAIRAGCWILIENAHLVTEWSKDVLNILYKIKDSEMSSEELDCWQDYNLNIPEARINEDSREKFNEFINPNFRIWFIAQSEQISNIPPSLIYNAIKITPQQAELKQTYSASQSVDFKLKNINENTMEEVCVLQSLISHNDFKNNYEWSLKDVHDYMRMLGELDELMSEESSTAAAVDDELFLNTLSEMIYACKTTNKIDLLFVKKLIYLTVIDKKYDMEQFIENAHKFYSKIENEANSKSLMCELKLICDVCREASSAEDSETAGHVYRDLVSLEFSSEFLRHLSDSLIDMKKCVENISNLTSSEKQNLTQPKISLLIDLTESRQLFESLIEKLSDLNESARGNKMAGLVTNSALRFYLKISNYRSKHTNSSFFEMLKILIKNSFDICDRLNEAELSEERLNLDVLFSAERVLGKVLYDAYQRLRKAAGEEELKKVETGSNSSLSLKAIQGSEKHFLLEVLDLDSQALKSSEFSVLLENICIVNAYHEPMSRSFKSTSSKSITKLKLVRVTPILNENSKPMHTFKLIPFVNYFSNETICVFRVKFWHSTQSSLSSTMGSSNSKESKWKDDLDQQQQQQQQQQQNIPILNPIYFSVFNASQEFIENLNTF